MPVVRIDQLSDGPRDTPVYLFNLILNEPFALLQDAPLLFGPCLPGVPPQGPHQGGRDTDVGGPVGLQHTAGGRGLCAVFAAVL